MHGGPALAIWLMSAILLILLLLVLSLLGIEVARTHTIRLNGKRMDDLVGLNQAMQRVERSMHAIQEGLTCTAREIRDLLDCWDHPASEEKKKEQH